MAGVEPTYRPHDGSDPLTFVLSANLHRRHLDTSQKAMVGAKVATLELGDNQHTANAVPSQDDTAKRSLDRIRRAGPNRRDSAMITHWEAGDRYGFDVAGD
jgi:hypothetical protein